MQLREKSEWISRRIFAIDRMPKPKLLMAGCGLLRSTVDTSIDAVTPLLTRLDSLDCGDVGGGIALRLKYALHYRVSRVSRQTNGSQRSREREGHST